MSEIISNQSMKVASNEINKSFSLCVNNTVSNVAVLYRIVNFNQPITLEIVRNTDTLMVNPIATVILNAQHLGKDVMTCIKDQCISWLGGFYCLIHGGVVGDVDICHSTPFSRQYSTRRGI